MEPGPPPAICRVLIHAASDATPFPVAPTVEGLPGIGEVSVFQTWHDLILAAETGHYELAVVDVAPLTDIAEIRPFMKRLRQAAHEMEIIALAPTPVEDLARDLRLLGVLDILEGDACQAAVLRRSVHWALERRDATRALHQASRLRHSDRLSEALLHEMRHAMFGLESDGRIAYANPASATLLGAEIPDLLGDPLPVRVEVSHRPRVQRALERCRAGHPTTGLACCLVRGETRRWVELDIAPWKRDDVTARGAVVMARDMSERQAVREDRPGETEELHATLAGVLDGLPVGMLLADARGRPTLVNREARDVLGMHALLPFDRWAAAGCFRRPDGTAVPDTELPFLQTLRDGQPRREVELRIERDGAPPLPVLVNTDAVRDLRGQIVEVSVALADISDRQAMAGQLQQAQKLVAIGTLAGGIAHDFNNILCAIMGYSELLMQRLAGEDAHRPLVEEIRKAGDKATVLTRQLLSFSRPDEEQTRIFNLNRSVTEMRQLIARLIGADIRIQLVLEEGLGNVRADPGRLGQIVLNLAVNARDAMPEGGVLTLRTCTQAGADPESPPRLLLRVEDTGTGIPDDVLPHIFEPFFTTKSADRGTGLGLATVYDIVQQSGASIRVESTLGEGTAFEVAFDRVEAVSSRSVAEPISTPTPSGNRQQVLLVEDEPMVRALMREILEAGDYAVTEASDGLQALKLLQDPARRVDLLVTDVVMPRLNGRDLADQAHGDRPDLPVLYVSGYTADALVRYGVDHEEMDFLHKPFAPSDLLERTRQLLSPSSREGAVGAA